MSNYYWIMLEIIMWIYTQNKISYLNINNPKWLLIKIMTWN